MNGEILELTGFAQDPAWLPWAVHYFFLIGVSIGAFFISLPSSLVGGEPSGAAKGALIAALTTGLVAPLALIADLHGPARFWHFYVYPHPSSWMAWGAFFLPTYVFLLALYALFVMRPQLAERGRTADGFGRIAAFLAGSGKPLLQFQRGAALLAVVAASLVALYTGAEVAVVAARPLWHTPLLPLAYLATGIAGGAGLALLFVQEAKALRTLCRWLTGALAATGIIVILWLSAGGASGAALRRLASEYQPALSAIWALFGILLPLVFAVRRRSPFVTGALALSGAWLFRWEMFMAGQAIPKNGAGFYGVELPLGFDGLLGIGGTAALWVFVALLITSLLRSSPTEI